VGTSPRNELRQSVDAFFFEAHVGNPPDRAAQMVRDVVEDELAMLVRESVDDSPVITVPVSFDINPLELTRITLNGEVGRVTRIVKEGRHMRLEFEMDEQDG
jgi:hypothetical protein